MSSVQCTFKAENTIFTMRKSCIVQNQILNHPNLQLQFNKKPIRKDDGNTTALGFKECSIRVWPCFDDIISLLPNMTSLTIKQCNLRKIEKDNFKGLYCLKELIITGNKIMCLPSDIFGNTRLLEVLCLSKNGIKYIDEGFLDPLMYIKYCDLTDNVNINTKYDATIIKSSMGLVAFKSEIKFRCQIKAIDLMRELEQSNSTGTAINQKSQGSEDNRKQKAYQEEIEKLKAQVRYWQSQCTDFSITIDSLDFKVHKSVLINASTLLKRLIKSTPDAENLILEDISVETFKTILDYMYDGKFSDARINAELYAACHKLEMKEMAVITANMLKLTIKKDNAYDVLMLSNKYENDELRMAAFKEFKKNFPTRKLSDEIARQPEALKKIMKAKLAMDEALASLESSLEFNQKM